MIIKKINIYYNIYNFRNKDFFLLFHKDMSFNFYLNKDNFSVHFFIHQKLFYMIIYFNMIIYHIKSMIFITNI